MTDFAKNYAEISNLLGRYGNIIDLKEWDRIPEFFSEDAIYDMSAIGVSNLVGMSEIREKWPQMPHYHSHTVVNIVIEDLRDDWAHVRARSLAINPHGRHVDAGFYEIIAVRTPAGWRVKQLDVKPVWPTELKPNG